MRRGTGLCFIPRRETALLSAPLLELAKRAFVIYLERGTNFEAVYGSMTSVAVALLWLYASSWALILGAEYNIVRYRGELESQPPDP